MLPSVLTRQMSEGLFEYFVTSFPTSEEPFVGAAEEAAQATDLLNHAAYISLKLPFRPSQEAAQYFEGVILPNKPYIHQERAFKRLRLGKSTIIATGTGSGKTECFLYPILEHCYRHRTERGVKAIIIYPMNALASDQAKRLARLIHDNPKLRGNINVGMYVGGTGGKISLGMGKENVITDHDTILNVKPSIILTNYKMLDYMLLRPKEIDLWKKNKSDTLKYIAVDELHTFDGAQGTDLACLLRRVKSRVNAQGVCCVGTSATMGGEKSTEQILKYAREIFGEEFDEESIITEDRLTAAEFLIGSEEKNKRIPTAEEAAELRRLVEEDDLEKYIRAAVKLWLPEFDREIMSDVGRIELGEQLKTHEFFRKLISITSRGNHGEKELAEKLSTRYEVMGSEYGGIILESLLALISHARSGEVGKMRPFLFVQVQFWMRELRRLLANVGAQKVKYRLAQDLPKEEQKKYLPVINCRDCGLTGWVSLKGSRNNVTMGGLKNFYKKFFGCDENIIMIFPRSKKEVKGMSEWKLCPNCLRLSAKDDEGKCVSCGAEMIEVSIPLKVDATDKQYICPSCGSTHGLSLVGMRGATAISAIISEVFASRFNDDKKILAFSDNVQDAAHKAGFFNSRTWRFGLRRAIQKYCDEFGANKTLSAFQDGFIEYWQKKMPNEEFVSFFIAPNMTYRQAYESMIVNRKLSSGERSKELIEDIKRRTKYEILLEYGLGSKIGRTLEKSNSSILFFSAEDIKAIGATVSERILNEENINVEKSVCEKIVIGYLNTLRLNGAFSDETFRSYLDNDFSDYLLTNSANRWMPGRQIGRNIPRFLVSGYKGKNGKKFDTPSSGKYTRNIKSCIGDEFVDESFYWAVSRIVLSEIVRSGVVEKRSYKDGRNIYSLNKNRVYVSNEVKQMRCDECGAIYAIAAANEEFWKDAPCMRIDCVGHLHEEKSASVNYYEKLYGNGDLERINAREHTGLLTRGDREEVEKDFKRKEDRKLWDPNILSCTPTLEMGIDIGDLSTVILCSMPPTQNQFLQRIGRAGRKDGNSLAITVANAQPHDAYFYEEPEDMISGAVSPPTIFLRATAVLERQMIAFLMDSWIKSGEMVENAIPDRVGTVLINLAYETKFPFNFFKYVKSEIPKLLNEFFEMFKNVWGEDDRDLRNKLKEFATYKDDTSPLTKKILEAFKSAKLQQEDLKNSVEKLKEMISEEKKRPKDPTFDEEIKALESEKEALVAFLDKLGKENIFNFMSDEGLLPNYAFPEEGITLKAMLYRDNDTDKENKVNLRRKTKKVYEYKRAASAAISEFAPDNKFYAGGRKLTIDQIDLKTTAEVEKWRLCPNCAHAELSDSGKNTEACPNCGSPLWADVGQRRDMLKLRMVYSIMDYAKSMIVDDADERRNISYLKQMLVDVDEEHDIKSAYRVGSESFPFGYEFVSKATIREINFGKYDIKGDMLSVAGVNEIRKGFKVCKHCGKVQTDIEKLNNHSPSCKVRREGGTADDYYENLYLFREFSTEILRILIPATSMDMSGARIESFAAAFMLGMKEYFGNVNHLQATISDVPVEGEDYRKNYLVIYDSIPGGTGYLEQLMRDKDFMINILEKSLERMETCSCKDNPEKDGCYRCLYAYRQNRNMQNVSRVEAIRMVKLILAAKGEIEEIKRINDIAVNPLFESELEAMFIDAIKTKFKADDFRKTNHNDKECYEVTAGEMKWLIEPQVNLGKSDGVAVNCRPDFIFHPVDAPKHKAIAIFTDGFTYHKDIAADDTLKRTAIMRSGKYRVWSLSYKDVLSVFEDLETFATNTLDESRMPFGQKFLAIVKQKNVKPLKISNMSAIDLLIEYIRNPDAEEIFSAHAFAYGYSLLESKSRKNPGAFKIWHEKISEVNNQTNYTQKNFGAGNTFFGSWLLKNLEIHSGIAEDLLGKNFSAVCAVLKDDKENRSSHYQEEWNGFLHFVNVMQFAEEFVGVSSSGLAQKIYLQLSGDVESSEDIGDENNAEDWRNIIEMLFDDEAKIFAEAAMNKGIPAPDEDDIGYELLGGNGGIIATVLIAWVKLKIGYVTSNQTDDEEKLKAAGWRIINLENIDELKNLFGGNE
ncbi:MAG: DEAD/DEAH box helicase [Selenomonadaceae bacterium]|nr:DEAD/DEAH box helicase [Selenomonadaceae bacterium]